MSEQADRIAVRELIEAYSVALNLRDFDMLRATFTDDGCWHADPPFNIRLEGSAIVDGISQMIGSMAFLFQGLMGTVVEIQGNTATARTSVHEVGQWDDEKGGLDSYGIYHDRLTRTPSGWRFLERRFQPRYLATAALPGSVITG